MTHGTEVMNVIFGLDPRWYAGVLFGLTYLFIMSDRINRAIVATRSHNPELMEPAFDAIVECLPQEAQRFFAEGMEQMAIIDYPTQVRDLVRRYYLAHTQRRLLH